MRILYSVLSLQTGGAGDTGFWLEVGKYGILAIVIVAGLRGLFVYRWTYDEVVKMLNTQIAEERQRTAEANQRADKAEQETRVMRDMLFESLGINRATLEKVNTALASASPTGTP